MNENVRPSLNEGNSANPQCHEVLPDQPTQFDIQEPLERVRISNNIGETILIDVAAKVSIGDKELLLIDTQNEALVPLGLDAVMHPGGVRIQVEEGRATSADSVKRSRYSLVDPIVIRDEGKNSHKRKSQGVCESPGMQTTYDREGRLSYDEKDHSRKSQDVLFKVRIEQDGMLSVTKVSHDSPPLRVYAANKKPDLNEEVMSMLVKREATARRERAARLNRKAIDATLEVIDSQPLS